LANLQAKKSDFISAVGAFSLQLLKDAQAADELAAFQTDNTFQSGGTNAVVDADCIGANVHLTAAQVNAVMTVAAAFSGSMTAARRTTLRQANSKPQT
jgi:uncharacterized membrane protein YgdD (TMEM256/DUF423 family)